MQILSSQFSDRAALTQYLQAQFNDLLPKTHRQASPVDGSNPTAQFIDQQIQPAAYARTRNFYQGAVSQLSPFVRQGMIERRHLANIALAKVGAKAAEKFIQELLWGEFWQHVADQRPDALWEDAEPYKTGFEAYTYKDTLPEDILRTETPNACINHFIQDLTVTGYLHNHARMYLAAYVVHFRRVRWQAGAAWFLEHLLDGDIAANNFSWQWVASTFGGKPYIFNLENVAKYCGDVVDCRPETNPELDATYEALHLRLFKRATS